jgi:hypothetical protein
VETAFVDPQKGDVFLNNFSPTGFYSSAVNNSFIKELRARNERQVPFSTEPEGYRTEPYLFGPRKRPHYVTPEDLEKAMVLLLNYILKQKRRTASSFWLSFYATQKYTEHKRGTFE